jgi:hypothetical protein
MAREVAQDQSNAACPREEGSKRSQGPIEVHYQIRGVLDSG